MSGKKEQNRGINDASVLVQETVPDNTDDRESSLKQRMEKEQPQDIYRQKAAAVLLSACLKEMEERSDSLLPSFHRSDTSSQAFRQFFQYLAIWFRSLKDRQSHQPSADHNMIPAHGNNDEIGTLLRKSFLESFRLFFLEFIISMELLADWLFHKGKNGGNWLVIRIRHLMDTLKERHFWNSLRKDILWRETVQKTRHVMESNKEKLAERKNLKKDPSSMDETFSAMKMQEGDSNKPAAFIHYPHDLDTRIPGERPERNDSLSDWRSFEAESERDSYRTFAYQPISKDPVQNQESFDELHSQDPLQMMRNVKEDPAVMIDPELESMQREKEWLSMQYERMMTMESAEKAARLRQKLLEQELMMRAQERDAMQKEMELLQSSSRKADLLRSKMMQKELQMREMERASMAKEREWLTASFAHAEEVRQKVRAKDLHEMAMEHASMQKEYEWLLASFAHAEEVRQKVRAKDLDEMAMERASMQKEYEWLLNSFAHAEEVRQKVRAKDLHEMAMEHAFMQKEYEWLLASFAHAEEVRQKVRAKDLHEMAMERASMQREYEWLLASFAHAEEVRQKVREKDLHEMVMERASMEREYEWLKFSSAAAEQTREKVALMIQDEMEAELASMIKERSILEQLTYLSLNRREQLAAKEMEKLRDEQELQMREQGLPAASYGQNDTPEEESEWQRILREETARIDSERIQSLNELYEYGDSYQKEDHAEEVHTEPEDLSRNSLIEQPSVLLQNEQNSQEENLSSADHQKTEHLNLSMAQEQIQKEHADLYESDVKSAEEIDQSSNKEVSEHPSVFDTVHLDLNELAEPAIPSVSASLSVFLPEITIPAVPTAEHNDNTAFENIEAEEPKAEQETIDLLNPSVSGPEAEVEEAYPESSAVFENIEAEDNHRDPETVELLNPSVSGPEGKAEEAYPESSAVFENIEAEDNHRDPETVELLNPSVSGPEGKAEEAYPESSAVFENIEAEDNQRDPETVELLNPSVSGPEGKAEEAYPESSAVFENIEAEDNHRDPETVELLNPSVSGPEAESEEAYPESSAVFENIEAEDNHRDQESVELLNPSVSGPEAESEEAYPESSAAFENIEAEAYQEKPEYRSGSEDKDADRNEIKQESERIRQRTPALAESVYYPSISAAPTLPPDAENPDLPIETEEAEQKGEASEESEQISVRPPASRIPAVLMIDSDEESVPEAAGIILLKNAVLAILYAGVMYCSAVMHAESAVKLSFLSILKVTAGITMVPAAVLCLFLIVAGLRKTEEGESVALITKWSSYALFTGILQIPCIAFFLIDSGKALALISAVSALSLVAVMWLIHLYCPKKRKAKVLSILLAALMIVTVCGMIVLMRGELRILSQLLP